MNRGFISVCNQSSGTRKKNAKNVYSEELGYMFLAKTSNSCGRDMYEKKKARQVEDAFSKRYKPDSHGGRRISR